MNGQISEMISEKIGRVSRELSDIKAQQIEAFLSQHTDKIGTHDLAFYPVKSWRMGTTTRWEQVYILIPKWMSADGPGLPAEDAITQYPHTLVQWALDDGRKYPLHFP